MTKNPLLVLIFLCVTSLISCIPSKRLYYFNDQEVGVQKIDSFAVNNIHRIKANDRVSIIVTCQDPALTSYLNVNAGNNLGEIGYLVSPDGDISFPAIGKVHIEGLTTIEAAALLKEKLNYLFKDVYVNINLKGRVFYLSGKKGGEIEILNERLTIIEALTKMPTIDPYDKRNNVMVVREEKGVRVFDTINLNSKKLFESDKFYLKNNDFVYVKPGKYNQTLFNSPGPLSSLIGVIGGLVAIFFTIRSVTK